jgi:DNA-binding CsgD family transcriptional regulator
MAYDITQKKIAEDILRKREKDLSDRTHELEEMNAAFKVLLTQREEDRIELEEKVLSNFKRLVQPFIEKLKKSNLDGTQEIYLKIIENNINDIISPFMRNLSTRYRSLTPMEIQVAALIEEGRTSKEIGRLLPEFCTKYRSEAQKALCLKGSCRDFDPQAYSPYGEDQNHETIFKDRALQAAVGSWCKIQVLNRSTHAVEFHRNNLRKKTGLTNKKINLRTFLHSLK